MTRQPSLDPALRARVLARDGHACVMCGTKGFLEIHHLVPRSTGGKDEVVNLVTLCEFHHACMDFGRRTYLPKHKRQQLPRPFPMKAAKAALQARNERLSG